MPLDDYGAIMRSGASLVPDYAAQQAQQQEMALRRDEGEQRKAVLAAKVAEAQQQLERGQQYQSELTKVMANPTAEGIFRLSTQFPENSEAIKRGWDAMDEPRRNADLRQMGSVFTRAAKGDTAGAAAELRNRIDADKAADGQADPQDEQVLAMLESDDPAAHKMAQTLIASGLLAVGGDKAKAMIAEVMPKPEYRETGGVVWDANTGGVLGQLPGQTVVIPDGGEVRPRSINGIPVLGGASAQPSQPTRGGGQASGGAGGAGGRGTPRPSLAPLDLKAASAVGSQFGTVTSTVRSPEHNRKVGGVPNSWHLKGRAIDIARKAGVSHSQIVDSYLRAGFQLIEQLDEGDHSHLAFAAGPSQTGGPVPVRSKQQFDKLASGTRFIAPDGTVRIKP